MAVLTDAQYFTHRFCAGTLARIDERLEELRELGASQLAAGRDELAQLAQLRAEARRRDAEVRDAQISAVRETSEQLARTLKRLIDSPEERRQLSRLGLERAAAFSWSVAARRTLDVYQQTMETHRTRAGAHST